MQSIDANHSPSLVEVQSKSLVVDKVFVDVHAPSARCLQVVKVPPSHELGPRRAADSRARTWVGRGVECEFKSGKSECVSASVSVSAWVGRALLYPSAWVRRVSARGGGVIEHGAHTRDCSTRVACAVPLMT
jgi:hypothetical protein